MMALDHKACVARIAAGKPCHACIDDGAFEIHIHDYVHWVCTAVHAGHRLRSELEAKCAWSEAQRRYEEDPCTDSLIADQPITVVARDSRFEYDLNRAPGSCIHETAWGRSVWHAPLSASERARSLEKHAGFYAVLGALYRKLESLHSAVLVYDVHAYNYRRPGMGETPVFNVGTEQIDMVRWGDHVEAWVKRLAQIRLPGIPVRAAINEVFRGRSYHATFVREKLTRTLILPTEVKKIFMDELSGGILPEVLNPLQAALGAAMHDNAMAFLAES